MAITLKNRSFEIQSATLSAAVPDPYWCRKYDPTGDPRLFWMLHVRATRETDGEFWEPRVYHENLHFPIRRWMDVVGQTVEWSGPYDDESGQPNGGFYVLEHGDIARARLCFAERDGARFRFEWEGVCDVFWNEEYGQNVPFSASGWAEFTGVTVRGNDSDTDQTLSLRLAEYLDTSDFIQGPLCHDGHRYQDGVAMAHVVFAPRT